MVYIRRKNYVKTFFICQFLFIVSAVWTIYRMCMCSSDGRTVSKDEDGQDKIASYVALFIITTPDNDDRRKTIRYTWLTLKPKGDVSIFYRFVVGTQGLDGSTLRRLNDENKQFGDLLMLDDLLDSYGILSRKVLKTITWSHKHVNAEYLLKVDDDSFVRIDAFIEALSTFDSNPRKHVLYWGFMDGRAQIIKKGKWAESEWILCDRYLPHALGGGYVLGRKLVDFLSTNAELFKMYKSEDVAVGTWLAGLDMLYVHDTRFNTEWKSRGCFNEYLITHKQNDKAMQRMIDTLRAEGKLCDEEIRLRYSYEYNWTAPASRCCKRTSSFLT